VTHLQLRGFGLVVGMLLLFMIVVLWWWFGGAASPEVLIF
jgi:hypothetical protein